MGRTDYVADILREILSDEALTEKQKQSERNTKCRKCGYGRDSACLGVFLEKVQSVGWRRYGSGLEGRRVSEWIGNGDR